MFNPDSIILYVDDVNISSAFYTKALKREPLETFQDFIVFSFNGNVTLGLQSKHAIDPAPQAHIGGVELCFSDVTREQVDEIYRQWTESEVSIVMTPVELEFGYTFVAVDPDGHRLRVCATDTANVS